MPELKINGLIVPNDDKWVYDWYEMESTAPKDVTNFIEKLNGEDLTVKINSGGGSVFAGSEIYTELKAYAGKVKIQIASIAASAASVIAMAGDSTEISPTAQIMIHNVTSGVRGDYRDLEHEAKVIKNYNKSIANAYILKTGMQEKELLSLMDRTTWLNAQQAKKSGFVDSIMFDEGNQLIAAMGSQMLPKEVINKLKNEMLDKKKQNDPGSEENVVLCKAKLNLLKLEVL